ncbi:MAG: triacylglycerol lipase [Pseudomonadota bacterium]|nr:triacylglycerol lipase [Pseudomonadota bacterium]
MKGIIIIAAGTLLSLSASAAQYYNCATDSGCVVAGNINTNSNYAKTKHPIVLAHGMAAFNSIGPISSWYGIPEDLTKNGATVYSTKVSSFESSEVRGEQLLQQVELISTLTPTGKVNLIGHSHGGQSVRYILGTAPQYVASVTALGSPHKGTPVADLVSTLADAPVTSALAPLVASVVNGLGLLTSLASGGGDYGQDSLAGLVSLTTAGSAAFNQNFPAGLPDTACGTGQTDINGIKLYSWSGTGTLTNFVDASDAAMLATSLAFLGEANDGLVGRCSSRFGQVIRDNYRMNHLDEVNHLFGLVSLFETNPKSVFRQHANRLKNANL